MPCDLLGVQQADGFGGFLDGRKVVIAGGDELFPGEGIEQNRIINGQQGVGDTLGEAVTEAVVQVATHGPVVVVVGWQQPYKNC